ncbi:glycosyltransferase involved in cell wall biosynthesis [Mariniflexile fucanivorans]|uniref:Glycosyltransferase involved in cell wall biosynthesis n=1 Tax=Mariniflexile fucanivorans TaxID=264023 RepID=A0A4R1RDF5_9FLAO|nr:glycosyltransferase family 2 protein [Mariniflexile fucanivorans]TCL63876.1 glycosyltransferase involved in cell wall biosynthesis [Mariniflexile fucanivorans]
MKISVLTPSFNSGNYIAKAIESVMRQTYTNWEHIIVDGKSIDNTISTLKDYPHVKWVSEKDSGQSDAMNKAFSLSTGDLIIYLNADDYFYPDAFQIFVGAFNKTPKADIIVGNLHMKINDKFIESSNVTISWKDLSILKGRFPTNPLSYMYKRKVQEKIGKFPIKEHYTMDYWFLLRAFYFFKPLKVEDFLGCFVFVKNNKSSTIQGEFQIQMPHALKFCLKYTPKRFLYVSKQLLTHAKNPNKQVKRILKNYRTIKNR